MKVEAMVCDLCHAKWFRGDLHICPRCGLQFCITCRSRREGDMSLTQPLKCLECGYAILSTDYLTEDEYNKQRESRSNSIDRSVSAASARAHKKVGNRMNVCRFSRDYIMKRLKRIRATTVCLSNHSTFSRNKRAGTKMLALIIGIVVCVAIALGTYYVLRPMLFSTPSPSPTPTPSPPDLQVFKIEIYPPQPRQYTAFQYSVWMVNVGGTKSGSYDLNVCIKDTSHDEYYYKGPFRLNPVDPTYLTNQAVLVFEGECIPNEPGWYEIWTQIVPVDFEDGDENNNIFTSQGFPVTY